MTKLSQYEQNLQSDDPFIKGMYEDLERRIQDYESSNHDKSNYTRWKDAGGVIVSMGAIIIFSIVSFM